MAQYLRFNSFTATIVVPSDAGVTVPVLLLSLGTLVSAFIISVTPALLQLTSDVSAFAPSKAVMSLAALPANTLNLPLHEFKL